MGITRNAQDPCLRPRRRFLFVRQVELRPWPFRQVEIADAPDDADNFAPGVPPLALAEIRLNVLSDRIFCGKELPRELLIHNRDPLALDAISLAKRPPLQQRDSQRLKRPRLHEVDGGYRYFARVNWPSRDAELTNAVVAEWNRIAAANRLNPRDSGDRGNQVTKESICFIFRILDRGRSQVKHKQVIRIGSRIRA